MSTYLILDLLHMWAHGKLTLEQAIGHLLQHVQSVSQRQTEMEKRVRTLEQQINAKQ